MLSDGRRGAAWRFRCVAIATGVVALCIVPVATAQRPPQVASGRQPETRLPRPDYTRVFAMDRVHEIRISIPAERYREMKADLAGFSRGRGARGFGPGLLPFPPDGLAEAAALQEAVAACSGAAVDTACSIRGDAGRCVSGFGDTLMCVPPRGPRQGGPPNGPAFSVREPVAVRVSVHASGRAWTHVRMRFKGNSSLMAATAEQNGKVPFRLEFASEERAEPGQTFFGFRKLTFSSNFADDSQMREVLATEVLRDRGVPAARAAFYRVFADTGEGPKYWGLYTMIEDPADGAMLDAQLGGRGGNLYKPEGPAANWTHFDAGSFEKKTNERLADFGDVRAAIDALHADVTDRAVWRAALERVFDADLFLRWLAVNTAIDNWDAYGAMAHNYYLYADAAHGGRLRWIPWDHNMAFGAGPGGGRGFAGRGNAFGGRIGPPPAAPGAALEAGPRPFGPGRGRPGGPPGRGTQDVLHRDVRYEWPLMARLLGDPVYAARYRSHLGDALSGLMAPEAIARRVGELHDLIAPAVIGRGGERDGFSTVASEAAFRDSAAGLLRTIERQRERIRAALAEPAR
jgi:hypothetical protein